MYCCEATSIGGFIQKLAIDYVQYGYFFYVTGTVPSGRDPRDIDRKLVAKYGTEISKWARSRRKKKGLSNVHYIRHGNFWVMLATKGENPWFEEEDWPSERARRKFGSKIQDVRKKPLVYSGYSVSYKLNSRSQRGHVSVRIHPHEYRALKAYFLDIATRRSVEKLRDELAHLPFEPYALIRIQYHHILDAVNAARKHSGFEQVPKICLSRTHLKRRIYRPFEAVWEFQRRAA